MAILSGVHCIIRKATCVLLGIIFCSMALTSSPLLDLFGPFGRPSGPFFLLLLGPTPVKVLHDDAHEHVQHEEAHQQQERDEVDQPPFVEVLTGLF